MTKAKSLKTFYPRKERGKTNGRLESVIGVYEDSFRSTYYQ
jgi:hypothetical protein